LLHFDPNYQDGLGVQAALVKASPINGGGADVAAGAGGAGAGADGADGGGGGASAIVVAKIVQAEKEQREATEQQEGAIAAPVFDGMTYCDYGYDVPVAQRWSFTTSGQIKQGSDTCLLATTPPALGSCKSEKAVWDLGRANETTAQIKTKETPQRCLKFMGGVEATVSGLPSAVVDLDSVCVSMVSGLPSAVVDLDPYIN
jgi:hypothetical protein